jgi:hypothetical protein
MKHTINIAQQQPQHNTDLQVTLQTILAFRSRQSLSNFF